MGKNVTSQAAVIALAKAAAPGAKKKMAALEAEAEKKRLLAEMLEPYSDGAAYDKTSVILKTGYFLDMASFAVVQAGKGLMMLKEHEGHGEFIQIVKDTLGLSRHVAAYYIKIARTFAELRSFDTFNKSHLRVLLDVPQDDLDEADDSGSLLGKPIDEVAAMPVRELQKEVRKNRERIEKGKEHVAAKNEQIVKLTEQVSKQDDEIKGRGKDFRTPEERALAAAMERFLQTIKGAYFSAEIAFNNIDRSVNLDAAAIDRCYLLAGKAVSESTLAHRAFEGIVADEFTRISEHTMD